MSKPLGRPSASPPKAPAAKAAPPAAKAVAAAAPPPFDLSKYLPEAQKAELRLVMDVIDDDKNGSISRKCLLRILRSFEKFYTEEQIEEYCRIIGLTGPNMRIDDLYLACAALLNFMNPLKVPFCFFDRADTGLIDAADVKKALERAGRTVPEETLAAFLGNGGKVSDGKVTFSDFCSLAGLPLTAPETKIFTHHVYYARFGDVCGVCKRLVTGQDKTLVNLVVYHTACFACAACERVLSAKDKFKRYQNRPLCENCRKPIVAFT